MSTYLTSCILGIICNQVFLSVFSPETTTTMAWWFSGPDWNGLKVKWGLNPFTSFNSMPRTVSDAIEDGFQQISGCDASATAKFRGARFTKNGDNKLVLLYDVSGHIAGIQTVIPDGLPHDYPERGETPPFVKIGSQFYLTAYFVDPGTICTTGRSNAEFQSQGTGTRLLIQNGENPDTDFVTAPMSESDAINTSWVQGNCFWTMGVHYWYNISKNMSCDNFFPVFLLYNSGKLNAFGWALGANLEAPNLEHPPPRSYKIFMKDPPTCLYRRGTLSTMHIFLTRFPRTNFC